MPNGNEVYSGDYLPCSTRSPLSFSEIDLVPPPDGMWIADKRVAQLIPIGALRNGDFIVPVLIADRCDELKGTWQAD